MNFEYYTTETPTAVPLESFLIQRLIKKSIEKQTTHNNILAQDSLNKDQKQYRKMKGKRNKNELWSNKLIQ